MLTEVTLSPAMGNYLDMANNRKPNAATGVEPDENYARELMQLFSSDSVELAPDGTPLHDAQDKPIAAYDRDEIEGYAHVVTGWTYPTAPGATSRPQNGAYFDGRVEERSALHDFRATLAKWLGASPTQMATVFPHLARFPTSDLGFMG